jgi:uncharacterized protein (DUF1697 family)
MRTYISFLRGINVGGHHKILMADLQKIYQNLALLEVKTYIQSGNVVFKVLENDNRTVKQLEQEIENAIKEKYQFEIAVIIRTVEELRKVAQENPFLQEDRDKNQLLVMFLQAKPTTESLEKLDSIDKNKFIPDEFLCIDKEIYLYCPKGYGTTKLTNNLFETKLKNIATTRNIKTVQIMLDLAL